MHRFWSSVIEPLFAVALPRVIVEIGVYKGEHSRKILTYCATHNAVLHGIDVVLTHEAKTLAEEHPGRYLLHKGMSLNVLPTIGATDVVLIDGDHNWYTVLQELRILERLAGPQTLFPLILLHDTGWPYGRRDRYEQIDNVPEIYRQPARVGGVTRTPGEVCLHGGFNPDVPHAIYEHPVHNGVRTAVEDFLAESHAPLDVIHLPGFHGLSILFDRRLSNVQPETAAFLRQLQLPQSLAALLQEVEDDRLDLLVENKALDEQRARATQQIRQRMVEKAQLEELHKRTQQELARSQVEHERLKNDRDNAKEQALRAREELAHIVGTRSWRITAPLRDAGAALNRAVYALFRGLKDIWEDFGSPLPGLVRMVRHGLLGRRWPARHTHVAMMEPAPAAVPSIPESMPTTRVAVIIPCHDYGRYLAEAIESVLRQTLRPCDVVVVDDASQDDTAEVAARYGPQGVKYLRGEWRNVSAARNAGVAMTDAEFLVFLDADDRLSPDYLAQGVQTLHDHPDAGLAYPDHQCFGASNDLRILPDPFDERRFDQLGGVSSVSVVRREALAQVGGWSGGPDRHADWITWRRVFALGWKAVKSPGRNEYRIHERNMHTHNYASVPYALRAGLVEEPATLCIALSGRAWVWPLTAQFLQTQTFPHDRLHLMILDTSQDAAFGAQVHAWLAHCDYAGFSYDREAVGPPHLADTPRANVQQEVRDACARIYNRFARQARTALVFFLEDDVIPPPDAYQRLTGQFAPEVLSVSAHYRHRTRNAPVAWSWTPNGGTADIEPGTGVAPVAGNGFGCLAVRGSFLREHVFHSGPPLYNFDLDFYARAAREDWTALLDWDCRCRHYESSTVWH